MIIGGIRRIGRVTSILAPGMAVIYVGGALFILLANIESVPASFALIVEQAFRPTSMVGGAAGSFLMTMMWGIRRGLFSNEAGQGSAPIAHAAARTQSPIRQGQIAMLGTVIEDQFTVVFNWPRGAALSFILLAIVLLILAVAWPGLRRHLPDG